MLRRLAALEQAQGCAVVSYRGDEVPEAALQRAATAGFSGGVLLVGEVLRPEVWTARARAHFEATARDWSRAANPVLAATPWLHSPK
uniref:Uncharacterized protein n=1 Tax=Variovorax paradoxus (strain S110) TaxID=543728 RepID=C5CUX5_VARPS